MIASFKRFAPAAALMTIAVSMATPASAQDATGVWLDHTGRGAVEISNCGGGLCGRIVWVKNSGHGSVCGTQVIGNVKAIGGGKWDKGWIFDPDANSRYSVEITALAGNRLKVMGYLGSKALSETMTWRRAPADLKRCNA